MKRFRVLLVDDAPEFLASTAQFLCRDSRLLIVGCARDGAEGVALARHLTPDLVVMDVAMPGISGFTAAAVIKKELPATRVLVTSLHDGPEYRRGAATVGADAFVGKAKLTETVLALVDEWQR